MLNVDFFFPCYASVYLGRYTQVLLDIEQL